MEKGERFVRVRFLLSGLEFVVFSATFPFFLRDRSVTREGLGDEKRRKEKELKTGSKIKKKGKSKVSIIL